MAFPLISIPPSLRCRLVYVPPTLSPPAMLSSLAGRSVWDCLTRYRYKNFIHMIFSYFLWRHKMRRGPFPWVTGRDWCVAIKRPVWILLSPVGHFLKAVEHSWQKQKSGHTTIVIYKPQLSVCLGAPELELIAISTSSKRVSLGLCLIRLYSYGHLIYVSLSEWMAVR